MDNSYAVVMTSLSEEALIRYIQQPEKYVPEAVEAAIQELQKRGKIFSPQELVAIEKILNLQKEKLQKQEQEEKKVLQPFPAEVSLKEELPKYYSEFSLYIISVIFGPFFASILLAINFKSAGNRKMIFPVILFGILYSFLSSFIFLYTGVNFIVYLLIAFAGAFILHQFFWNRYLGKNIPYQRRALWLPFLIFFIISMSLVIIILIYSQSTGTKLPTGI